MKDFHRDNPLFSLCGLNCGLCTMQVGGYCPGCGGEGSQGCAIARCSKAHENVPYCFQCSEYPCARYAGFDKYDSFLPGRNRRKDVARAKEIGLPAYMEELGKKRALADSLLANYNDGRRKSLFLTAVYLMDLADIEAIAALLPPLSLPIRERAEAAASLFRAMAEERGIDLKLHKKPKEPKTP